MKRFIIYSLACGLAYSCTSSQEPSNTKKETASTDTVQYAGPHHAHHAMYSAIGATGEAQWDSVHGIKPVDKTDLDFDHSSHPDYKIFGWHMYSGGTAWKEYNYSLMWGLSYFCYDVDPATGNYKTIYDWKTTEMIDRAKSSGCKVFLTAGNFGNSDNSKLLNNPAALSRLSDSLVALIKYRKADGVNIDFEGIPANCRDKFSKFIVDLSAKLKAEDPEYMMTIALYAVDYSKVFDIKAINDAVDTYIIMGYDYYGGFSSAAGPSAPLASSNTWGKESLEHSVDYYLEAGVQPSKLILGLPYYGNEWNVQAQSLPAKVKKFDRTLSYRMVREQLKSGSLKPQLNKETSSSYYEFTDTSGSRQVWFEDTLSLALKYDYIKSKGLAGAGIWALGYDHGYNDLWNLLGEKLGKRKK